MTEKLTPSLLFYLQRYAGDGSTVEDLLQETLLRATRGVESFAGDASHKTWVYSIATRVAADYLRQPARRLHVVEFVEADAPVGPDESADERLIVDEMNTSDGPAVVRKTKRAGRSTGSLVHQAVLVELNGIEPMTS